MAEKRLPFPQWNPLRQFVQAELRRRKNVPVVADTGVLGNLEDNRYTPTISPFVRMTSTLQDLNGFNYKFFSLGLHGAPDANTVDIFDLSYGTQDVIGYAYDSSNAAATKARSTVIAQKRITSKQNKVTKNIEDPVFGRHAIPGITHISVQHKGLNDVIQIAVTWKCYNPVQLEFLKPHFITAGHYVVVELGHQYANRPPTKTFQWKNVDALDELAQMVVQGRSYINDTVVEAAQGNYELFVGTVMDTETNQQSDGTFEVITNIISKGEAVFGLNNTRAQSYDTGSDLRPTTIHDYFDKDGRFDDLLAEGLKAKKGVIDLTTSNIITRLLADSNTPGTVFISWDFLINQMMPDLMNLFSGPGVSNDIVHFKTINQTFNQTVDDEPWVGNHPELLSTDVRTLVIVKKAAQAKSGDADPFRGQDVFEDDGSTGTSQSFRGRLSKGIWLNAEMVRSVFLQQSSFLETFQDLLRRMNLASADYWKLDITWDEDKGRIVIFDHCMVTHDLGRSDGVYHFNRGRRGELLELSFQAQYTKEAKIAALLSDPDRSDQIQNQSGIQGPDPHPTLLNALNTEDGRYHALLDAAVNNLKKQQREKVDPAFSSKEKRDLAVNRLIADKARKEQEQKDQSEQDKVLKHFKDQLKFYTAIASVIKSRIYHDGIQGPFKPNNYIAPLPTDINLSLTIQGIGGIAFLDAFLVDKLPISYSRHGLFLVNTISHEVTVEAGWHTKIGGLFYFLHPGKLNA